MCAHGRLESSWFPCIFLCLISLCSADWFLQHLTTPQNPVVSHVHPHASTHSYREIDPVAHNLRLLQCSRGEATAFREGVPPHNSTDNIALTLGLTSGLTLGLTSGLTLGLTSGLTLGVWVGLSDTPQQCLSLLCVSASALHNAVCVYVCFSLGTAQRCMCVCVFQPRHCTTRYVCVCGLCVWGGFANPALTPCTPAALTETQGGCERGYGGGAGFCAELVPVFPCLESNQLGQNIP
jgi:hypothetical protein